MDKNETSLNGGGEETVWIRLEAPSLIQLVNLGLLMAILLLVFVGFYFNRHHHSQMHALFADFFRFYIHVSKYSFLIKKNNMISRIF